MSPKFTAPKSRIAVRYRKVRIFSIPVTNIEPTEIGAAIDQFIQSDQTAQIVFLSWWGMIRAFCKWDYKAVVRNAALVIPTSPLISLGSYLLYGRRLHCYSDFDFTIKVLSRVEEHSGSIYLLGMELIHLHEMEQNIKNTFPNLMIVGRYSGYFSLAQEQKIITAIRKARPTLLFVGTGVPGRDIWLYRVKHKIKSCVTLWSGITMDILAARTRKLPHGAVRTLFYALYQFMMRPWRIYRFFVFLFYVCALLYSRILRR